MDTATEINRRAILLRIYSGVSGGFASFHDCFGRLRAARPFTPLPSLPPYCGGTARRPSRSGGSARGGAAARGPRGPERCVPGEGPGWAGGGVAGWAVFTSNAFVILGVRPRLWGRGFPPPSRTAGRPSPGRAAPPFGSSQLMQTPIGSPGNPPAHSDPHCQPRSRPQPTQTSIAKLRAPL